MNIRQWKLEHAWYGLALVLALALRLVRLGAAPLSDFEASWAVQAWNLAHGLPAVLGPQPGYLAFTGLLFSVLGDTNSLARLWPALSGSLLAISPFFFRRWIGRLPALILAFALALDPGLVVLSRLAGSPAPAVAFLVLSLAAVLARRPLWAGVMGGLALISGPGILPGLISLGLTWVISYYLEKVGVLPPLFEGQGETSITEGTADYTGARVYDVSNPVYDRSAALRTGLYVTAAVLFLGGTLFFKFPQALGALANIIPVYLAGWSQPSGMPVLRLLAVLPLYAILPLIFGLVGAAAAWWPGHDLNGAERRLSFWALLALALALVYPARQSADLAWVLVPLWAIASMEIAALILPKKGQEIEYSDVAWVGQAALIFVLSAFAWLNLGALLNLRFAQVQASDWSLVLLLVGALIMAALTTMLVMMGWNWEIARRGLVIGLVAALGIFTLSSTIRMSQVMPEGQADYWLPPPYTSQADLLSASLDNLSRWNLGLGHELDIVSLVDAPSLRWVLRKYSQTQFAGSLTPGAQPSVVITPDSQKSLDLPASYRGQDFSWQVYPGFTSALPPDFLRWLYYKSQPYQTSKLILWVRGDLFPGGTGSAPNP